MDSITDPLLRTLAAVPPQSRVLNLGCGEGHLAASLVRLGFDLYACDADAAAVVAARSRLLVAMDAAEVARRITPACVEALGYPDAFFDWIIACEAYEQRGALRDLREALAETRRVLKPGGWLFVAFAAGSIPVLTAPRGRPAQAEARPAEIGLNGLMEAVGFAVAEAPLQVELGSRAFVRGIYRRVDVGTPL